MSIEMQAVGRVTAARVDAADDFWGGLQSRITLADAFPPESLQGLEQFSHVEIVFHFHAVEPSKVVTAARHPRSNTAWPAVGIFAQRGKNRPNRIGTTICRLLRVDDRSLWVEGLDAIDGTPVLDIKPVMVEFLPREPVRQPPWSHELMRRYWLDQAVRT